MQFPGASFKSLVLLMPLIASCSPDPTAGAGVNADPRWNDDAAREMGALPADAPRFECAVNEVDWLDSKAPLKPAAVALTQLRVEKVGPDLVRIRAKDQRDAEERLYRAYAGPRPLLVDQCLPVDVGGTQPPPHALFAPLESQRQLAYHAARFTGTDKAGLKRLACLAVLRCKQDDNPFDSEDSIAAVTPYLLRGVERAARFPFLRAQVQSHLSPYDMEDETYALGFGGDIVPNIDDYGSGGTTPQHRLVPTTMIPYDDLEDDPAAANYVVRLPIESRGSVALNVPKAQARVIENAVDMHGRDIATYVYATIRSVDGTRVVLDPMALEADASGSFVSAPPISIDWKAATVGDTSY